ncbi:MAG: Ig-like domain-containing protein [bacterium]|nr:Ig-like domain-containing protein [bacterium]
MAQTGTCAAESRNRRLKRSAGLAALILFLGCARQMAPPGGPPDTNSPSILETSPANDATGVGLDARVAIRFSEEMDHRSVEDALFISPQGTGPPRFKWRGEWLEIRQPDGLRADRTYVVTIGQAAADAWRNRLLASYSFRFATGEKVNRGELAGRVTGSRNQGGQIFVWLYDLGLSQEPDIARTAAHYVTQPDEEGKYRFSGLGSGLYRLFAWLDSDQNRAYTPGIDALGVASQDVPIAADSGPFRLGDMKAVVRDTSAPILTAIRTSDQHHILLRFDAPVHIETPPTVEGLSVLAVYQDMDSSRVGLLTEKQVEGKTYPVRLSVSDRSGNRIDAQTSVRGDGMSDRRPPDVLGLDPALLAETVRPWTPLRMVFSEAMDREIAHSIWAISDSTLSPVGDFDWTAPNCLVFRPRSAWPGGRVSVWSLPGVLKDASGNPLAEPVVFEFTCVDSQATGSIAGLLDPGDRPRWVEAISTQDDRMPLIARVAPGDSTFEFADVLPGTYRVSGFVDTDDDGRWDRGDADPFRPSEVLFSVSDTVDVRPRWRVNTRRLEAKQHWMMTPDREENP